MRKIVIFGATSAIAAATARLYAVEGDSFFLVGRDRDKLASVRGDLEARGAAQVVVKAADLCDLSHHATMVQDAQMALNGVDVVLIAHGSLGDQSKAEASFDAAHEELRVNLLSVLSLITVWANFFEEQKSGILAVIGSVAGDRGRKSNYFYGTAKGAVAIFLQGVRNRLHEAGVTVLTIKPGFVDTPMTADFKKGLLFAQPETVALGIVRAIEKKRDVVYLPWFWRVIMYIIRLIPEFIFKRLSI